MGGSALNAKMKRNSLPGFSARSPGRARVSKTNSAPLSEKSMNDRLNLLELLPHPGHFQHQNGEHELQRHAPTDGPPIHRAQIEETRRGRVAKKQMTPTAAWPRKPTESRTR